jgi:hypothetical protein
MFFESGAFGAKQELFSEWDSSPSGPSQLLQNSTPSSYYIISNESNRQKRGIKDGGFALGDF